MTAPLDYGRLTRNIDQEDEMSTPTRRESVRQEITLGALRALQARSWDEVGTREVAAEAGISLGRLHYYFESKEALILAAVQLFYDELLEQFLSAFSGKEPIEIVRGMIRGAHFEPGAPESAGRVRMQAEARIRSLRDKSIEPIVIRYRHGLRAAVVEAFCDAHMTRKQAEALAIIVLDFLESFTPHRIQESDTMDVAAVEELFIAMIERELAAGRPAKRKAK